MFLRSTNRRKDGKDHRYFSVVENRRLPGGKTAQRTVLYLGEINDQQQAAWRKTLEVFDESEQRLTTVSARFSRAQAAGAPAAQAAHHAQEPTETRSVVAAHRGGEKGSRPRLRVHENSAPAKGRRGHARKLLNNVTAITYCAAI
jgi:hypothetical protein